MELLDKPQGGAPSMATSSPQTHNGAKTITSDISIKGEEFNSSSTSENAILIEGGSVTFDDITVIKTGDDDGDDSDFYGTNAAIFATNGSDVKIKDSKVETNGTHANAVFSYSNATIDIDSTEIHTKGNNSGGIMVTGGGSITANNLTVNTEGNSSAAIRSDRGGGTIYAKGGTYATSGVGSPAIYSTADITTDGATLKSSTSEGVVIEGSNSITLKDTTLDATNTTLNGKSETYKTIFIYQSMSGDASEGTGTFTAEDSEITTGKGDHFYITNTTAKINLTNTIFTQNDASGAFLRAESAGWGESGSNGGKVTLSAKSQEIIGDIVIDSVSSLDFKTDYSYVKTSFTGEGAINLDVSSDSIIVLTADSKVSTLTNAISDNSNIYANGYKLYVGGEEVKTNQEAAPESFLAKETTTTTTVGVVESNGKDIGFPTWGYFAIGGGAVIMIALVVALVMCLKKDKKNKALTNSSQTGLPPEQPMTDPFTNSTTTSEQTPPTVPPTA